MLFGVLLVYSLVRYSCSAVISHYFRTQSSNLSGLKLMTTLESDTQTECGLKRLQYGAEVHQFDIKTKTCYLYMWCKKITDECMDKDSPADGTIFCKLKKIEELYTAPDTTIDLSCLGYMINTTAMNVIGYSIRRCESENKTLKLHASIKLRNSTLTGYAVKMDFKEELDAVPRSFIVTRVGEEYFEKVFYGDNQLTCEKEAAFWLQWDTTGIQIGRGLKPGFNKLASFTDQPEFLYDAVYIYSQANIFWKFYF